MDRNIDPFGSNHPQGYPLLGAESRLTTEVRSATSLANEALSECSFALAAPCVSLYQPTHRRHPENQQDPIRFRNLLKELEASLRQGYAAAEVRQVLEPFEALAHDADLQAHGLAADPGGVGAERCW